MGPRHGNWTSQGQTLSEIGNAPIVISDASGLPHRLDQISGVGHFIFHLVQYQFRAYSICENIDFISQTTCRNGLFTRIAGRQLSDIQDPGALPSGFPFPWWGPKVGDSPPDLIDGNSGWLPDVIDDNTPARHFTAWLSYGFFHEGQAWLALRIRERQGATGQSLQDVTSGDIAINIGIALHHEDLTVPQAITRIGREVGADWFPGYSDPYTHQQNSGIP